MLHVPFRGGVRGGKDQFTWESVKTDKDREYYLGHSIKAPVGRWQKGKDIHWYANDSSIAQQAKNEEFQKAKDLEEKALMAALGYKVVEKPKEERVERRSRTDDSESESESEQEERSKRNSKKKDKKASKVSGPSSLNSNEKKKLDDMLKKLVKTHGLEKVFKALIVDSDSDESSEEERSRKRKSKKEKKEKSKKKSSKKDSSEDESSEEDERRRDKKRSDLKRRHSRERDYESKRKYRSDR